MKKISRVEIKKFQQEVWDFYHLQGRHDLPWRPPQLKIQNGILDLYTILVSEIMLQQTQVVRVLPKFKVWMKKFPTAKKLASASRKDVFDTWQGLGYTRRAKFLQESALLINKNGVPAAVNELESLPGVGHYTAHAVATFAWNESYPFIETNIRTVYIHHFFKNRKVVEDKEILSFVKQTLDTAKPREWMYALMDYGSFLKSNGISYNARVKSIRKQGKFKGSVREVRGSIMKFFTTSSILTPFAVKRLEMRFDSNRVTRALEGLIKDGLVVRIKKNYHLSDERGQS